MTSQWCLLKIRLCEDTRRLTKKQWFPPPVSHGAPLICFMLIAVVFTFGRNVRCFWCVPFMRGGAQWGGYFVFPADICKCPTQARIQGQCHPNFVVSRTLFIKKLNKNKNLRPHKMYFRPPVVSRAGCMPDGKVERVTVQRSPFPGLSWSFNARAKDRNFARVCDLGETISCCRVRTDTAVIWAAVIFTKILSLVTVCWKPQPYVWEPEVPGVIFSDPGSVPVPKFLNPGPAIFQIRESDSCSDSGCNHWSNLNLPRPVARFWELVGHNTFLGEHDFCFHCMFKTNFFGGTK